MHSVQASNSMGMAMWKFSAVRESRNKQTVGCTTTFVLQGILYGTGLYPLKFFVLKIRYITDFIGD